ncbi:hypothetical protein AB0764_26645 (plasmid) [Priestia megaterium]|uniref:hypothetical protein n=1 Tax=Priestia megaterium TaxID=1404 RepID=UPI003878219C
MPKTFKVNYSVLKKNKLVHGSIIIHSAKEKNEIIKSATLDISTKERVFVQHVKILGLKPIRLI